MKTITKIKESSKAVAGTALLVGATLAGGAAFATAQDSGSSGDATLGDYPSPFIDDDGNIASTLVMGEDAKATDVVAATEIAGQLGNDAFSSETVSAGGASFGWSAATGQTLDTQNDNLYFGQSIDEVRETLTEDQLDVLQTTEGFSGDAEQEVEQYLYVGSQGINFGTPGDTDGEEDPFLYVNNPSGVENADITDDNSENDYLYRMQANFEDGAEFYDTNGDNNRNEDVYGEEFTIFGMDFTVADASFQNGNDGQLILYGSSEEVSVNSGESETITVNGEEHTIEVVGVTGSNTAAVRIDGSLEQYEENDEETLSGQDVRIDNIIQTNADNSQGVVQFAIGSERMVLEDEEPIVTGEDDEEVDGTQVLLSGSNVGGSVEGGDDVELSSIEVAVGADDSDNNYVRADEPFSGPVFTDVEFHFAGLNPDAGEGASDSVGEIDFGTDGDDTATVSISDGDNSASLPFVYDDSLTDSTTQLEADDDETIHVQEGVAVQEDEYIATDAGDFSHMWQVNSIDTDADSNLQSDDEATVEIEDAVTGASIELDLDASDGPDGGTVGDDPEQNGDDIYAGEEVIDGQTYHIWTNDVDAGLDEVYITYGSGSDFADTGDETGVFTPVDTDSGAAVGFYNDVTGLNIGSSATDGVGTGSWSGDAADDDYEVTFEVPSTESTDAKTVTVTADETTNSNDDPTSGDINLEYGETGFTQVGELNYRATVNGSGALSFGLHDGDNDADLDNQDTTTGDDVVFGSPSAIVVQPEDDNDNEEAYVHTPGTDTNDEELDAGGDDASIFFSGGYNTQTLESDDDMEVAYNMFGTHTMQDTEDQGSFTLHIPDGQSTAGAAFTAQDGELSGSSSGAGSVDTMSPTGWPAQSVALDNDDFVPNARTSSNLILVGGPAANSLVGELADENQTWSTSDYTEGEGLLQLVPEAFNEDYHALVVAGFTGEDTRQAGEFLSNYEQNSEALAGQTQVSISTAEGSVVQ